MAIWIPMVIIINVEIRVSVPVIIPTTNDVGSRVAVAE